MQKGCACRFLYGSDTAEEHRRQIELALQEKIELKLEVMFYRKNGEKRSKTPAPCWFATWLVKGFFVLIFFFFNVIISLD